MAIELNNELLIKTGAGFLASVTIAASAGFFVGQSGNQNTPGTCPSELCSEQTQPLENQVDDLERQLQEFTTTTAQLNEARDQLGTVNTDLEQTRSELETVRSQNTALQTRLDGLPTYYPPANAPNAVDDGRVMSPPRCRVQDGYLECDFTVWMQQSSRRICIFATPQLRGYRSRAYFTSSVSDVSALLFPEEENSGVHCEIYIDNDARRIDIRFDNAPEGPVDKVSLEIQIGFTPDIPDGRFEFVDVPVN